MNRKDRLQNWLLREDQPFKGTIINVCDGWSAIIQEQSGFTRPNVAQITLGFIKGMRDGRDNRTLRSLTAAVEKKCGASHPIHREIVEILREFI